MQRVDFEAIAGTRFDQYMPKLRIILSFLQQPGSTKFKVFRDFVRKQNMWDKDRAPVLFSLVDVTWDKTNVRVGRTARQLAQARSDQDFQQALFDRLKEVNILLVKYVLEALDVQQGGRLHSIHELYRMITSYVYPGKYITLTAFQAWVDWLAASGVIKLIGIRWGLSERGQKLVPELRAMDLDEILEDMEDEADGEGEADEDGDDADEDEAPSAGFASGSAAPSGWPAAATATKAAPSGQKAPGAAAPASAKGGDFNFDDDGFDEEDLFSDLPPEPEVPSEAAISAASSRLGLKEDDEDEEAPPARTASAAPRATPAPAAQPVAKPSPSAAARPAARSVTPGPTQRQPPQGMTATPASELRLPLAGPAPVVLPAAAFDTREAGQAAILGQLEAWHALFGGWPALDAATLGVVHRAEAGDRAILVELGVLAVVVEGREADPQTLAFVARLRAADFFARLLAPGGTEGAMEAAEALGEAPWARGLFERLAHAPGIARRAGDAFDLLYRLRQAGSGAEAIGLLRDHLVGRSWREAPFYVLRELVRLGLVETEAAREAVVVPTARLARNAAALGLATTHHLSDFKNLLALSVTASALVGGPAFGYGLALERADLGFGDRASG